jgi:hypothetical protein
MVYYQDAKVRHTNTGRFPVAVIASIAQLLTFYVCDYIDCSVTKSVIDDGSMRALAIFEPWILVAYLLAYWVFVYPLLLWLGERLKYTLAVPIGAALVSVMACLVLHDKAVDKNVFSAISNLFPMFFFPWMVGGYIDLGLNLRVQKLAKYD